MSRPNTRSEHLEDDHVADYFGGDHAMASMFLDVLRSDVASGTALAAIAKKYFHGDVETARGFCALAAETKMRCREAEAQKEAEQAELEQIAQQTSASLREKRLAKARETEERETRTRLHSLSNVSQRTPSQALQRKQATRKGSSDQVDMIERALARTASQISVAESPPDTNLEPDIESPGHQTCPARYDAKQGNKAGVPPSLLGRSNSATSDHSADGQAAEILNPRRVLISHSCPRMPDHCDVITPPKEVPGSAIAAARLLSPTPEENQTEEKQEARKTSFQTKSVQDKVQDREKEVQRTMSLLRALEHTRLDTGQGYLQLQDVVRPKSYTHELLKNAGLKYRRGKPVFDEPSSSRRSTSTLSYVDGPAWHRYREEGTSVAKVSRRSRSTTPGLDHTDISGTPLVTHQETYINARASVGGPRGILRWKSRPMVNDNLSFHSEPIEVLQRDQLSISLPVLCHRRSSETGELKAVLTAPDAQQEKQEKLDADLDDDPDNQEPEVIAKKRLKSSRAELAKKIALGMDESTILLSTKATISTIEHHIITHDGDARDKMRRVESILGDVYGIDIRKYGIPIRVTDSMSEIMRAHLAQKSRLNAHTLDVAPRAAFTKNEITLPKGMGRHLHTASYYQNQDITDAVGDRPRSSPAKTEGDRPLSSRSGRIRLPPMEHQRLKVEASVARAHVSVHRDVEEIIVLRGMSSYQLSSEVAKVVGRAFLFLEHYDGLDAHTEGAFCELCSYLWAREEKSQLIVAAEKTHVKIAELECQLNFVRDEIKVLEVHVKEAHREREEANAAELHAKKTLAAARDAVKYGWPGAQRKMDAAKLAQKDAARELEEAEEAEEKVIGKEYPAALEKQKHVLAELEKERLRLEETEAATSAYRMYMLTQENNPHPIYGDTFRKALLGYESVEGRMRPFLQYLKEASQFVQPRPKTKEELEAEEQETQLLIQVEIDRQNEVQREQLGTLFGRITHRLKSAPPGAPGAAVLSHHDKPVRVKAEPAKTFDDQVMDALDDKLRFSGTGGLTASELAEYCSMTVRGKHDELYCFQVGEMALKEAKQMRFSGELDGAKKALEHSTAAFTHAGSTARQLKGELEYVEKMVTREWNLLQKALVCHELAGKILESSGNLVIFRRYWDEAKSLYESCGAAGTKPEHLPALLKWDENIKLQEKDVKVMIDAISATNEALGKNDMVTAVQQVHIANSLIEACGKAAMDNSDKARQLLQKVLDIILEQRKQQESLCKVAIGNEKFGSAQNSISDIWKSCRLAAIAVGEVQNDADETLLIAAEKAQAKLMGSPVVNLAEELAGTQEQFNAMKIVSSLDLLSWPEDKEVAEYTSKASAALTHLSAARTHLEAAATPEAFEKVRALQALELDLALRVHSNDMVAKLIGKISKKEINSGPSDALPFLCTAAAADNTEGLALLLSANGDVNLVDTKNNTPVHHAVKCKAWNALKVLGKDRMTNPNKVNAEGFTPLHMAVLGKTQGSTGPKLKGFAKGLGKVTKEGAFKLQAGAGILNAVQLDKTATDLNSYKEGVRILLSDFWKMNPNVLSGKDQMTPLHSAGELGNFDAQELLLKHSKVDPNIMDKRGRTPLIATVWAKRDISRFLGNPKVDVNQVLPKYGWSALHVCVIKNSLECMQALLKCDRVNVSAEDRCGYTATHLAMYSDFYPAINILMAVKAVQDVGGPQMLHLLGTVRRFHEKGNPFNQGIWTQATRETLELVPFLFLGLRMWEQLHATLCNIAFASAVLENLGVDTAISLFASARRAISRFDGVKEDLCNDFSLYQECLEKHSYGLRMAQLQFADIAIENHLWGVRSAQHSVSASIGDVDQIREDFASKVKKESQAFFECLASRQNIETIAKLSLQKILNSERAFTRVSVFMKQIHNLTNGIEELHQHFLHVMDSVESSRIEPELRIQQISSLLTLPKNQEETGALKIVMKNTIDVSNMRSRLCEALLNVVPSNELHVLLRVVRVYVHSNKIVAIIVLSKNPMKSATSFGDGRMAKARNAIIDSFRMKSNDTRLTPLIQEFKILSITPIDPSVFILLDVVPPWTIVKNYMNVEEYGSQVLNDIRNSCNMQPNLLRLCKVSKSWNQVVIELLHDDINPSNSFEKNRDMAKKIAKMVHTPSTVLYKGVITQNIACCTVHEGHVVPRFEGEWQHFQVRVTGSCIAMHNETKFLEDIILPAARQFAIRHKCYLSWTVSQDEIESKNIKNHGHTLHEMEKNDADHEIVIGLVGDQFGTIMAAELQHEFLDNPDMKEVYILIRDLERLKDAGFPPEYMTSLSDINNPEAYDLLNKLKILLDRHKGKRVDHYSPAVKGFHLDCERVFKEINTGIKKWNISNQSLNHLKESSSDPNDASTIFAKKFTENRMKQLSESCGRWIKVLRAEEKQGGLLPEMLDRVKQLEELPIFANQCEPNMDIRTPDFSDVRLALGLELEVRVDMLHIGMAIADSIKATSAPCTPKPPFHSHLHHREMFEITRISHSDHFCVEQHSALDRTLQELEMATCSGAPIQRSKSDIERQKSSPVAEKKPIVLLTGTPGSGKTKALAVLSKRTLTARNDSSRHAANVQIYFQMTGKHNMESALRYIYLELVLQLRGVTELKHSSPMGTFEELCSKFKEEINALSSGNGGKGVSVLLLIDDFDRRQMQIMTEILLSCNDKHIQCVMTAESEAAITPGTVSKEQLSVFELPGLCKAEALQILSNFGMRFHTHNLTEVQVNHVADKEVAKNPLYLLVWGIICLLAPSWVEMTFPLPDEVTKLFELFLIPFLSEWLRVPPRVIEALIEMVRMYPHGTRVESLHVEVQELLPPELKDEASISKISMSIAILAPILRPGRNGLISLENPWLVASLSSFSQLEKALNTINLAEGSVTPKSGNVRAGDDMEGNLHLDSESTDPLLLERLKILSGHYVELFHTRSTRPILAALESDNRLALKLDAAVGAQGQRDWQWAMKLVHEEEAENKKFNISALCDGEDITTAIDEWCVKAERVLNQHESDDENSALRIESSFDVCYEQLIRLRTLQDSLDDHDFVLASIGLEMTIEVWANTTTLGNSATFCLTRFKETVARISRDLDYFERKCQELLERLVIFYRREWELKDKGCISVVKRLAYGMVVEFKGRIEMLNRGASRHATHGLTSPWTKLTSGANQMACEILQQSLEEDVQRITDIMHKKLEEKWAAGVALLREKLEKQNIHEALSAYETARTCGFYTIEAIDAQDPSTRDERLLEMWTLKTKLDKGCQTLITCAATSVAFGPALTFQDAIVSIPTVFIIQSKNSKGELLEKGGEAEFWEIKITDGHGLVDFELLDNSNGTYEVTFVPRYEEGCQVSVAFRTGTKSQPLKGSPLNLKFRRDSFWIRRPVSDMPQNLGGRILLAGTTDMMIFFDPEQKEVYRLVQDREKECRAVIWRCTKGRLDGEDIRGRRMKGLFSISNNMFIAFTKALSQLYEGFDHSCFLLEMKENNTLFSKLLTTFEEDLPPDLIQIFTEKKHWAWSNVTCKTKDKMQGIPEFLPSHQVAPEILQLLEELLAQAGAPQECSTEVDSLSNTIAPNQPKLSISSSTETIMQLDHFEVNSCKAKMPLVKGSCRTYEDFSLPIVIASVQHVEGQAVPVAITMTNFDQYSRTWHKRDSAIYCHGKLVVFGGCSEHTKLLTCYHPADAKNRATLEFQTVNAVGNIPCTRCNFYLGYTGKSILLHGGIDVNDQVLNDVYTYDLEHHRWFRLLSISIPSTLSSVYAAGMDSILTLYPGTPNMRMNIVDMQKILPRNSLHMCATFANDLITKVRSEMRSIQHSMNLQDSWLLRLAVFRTLNRTDLVANLENISEMIAFLKVHAEELSFDITKIAEDFHSTRNLHQDLVKVATEWQVRLKKKEKSAKKETLYLHAPHGHFESCCRLRIKCLNSQDMTVNAEFAFSSAKYSAAIKAIEQPTKALQNLKNDCIEFEELTTFFGVDPRMEEEKEIINKQLNTLSSFRRAWELHEQLYKWSDLLLGLPNLQGESILNEMKADLLDMASCSKFAASDLFRTLSQNILDADAALRFVDLLKLDSATCRNSWYAIRILCGLSQNILYPPTLGTILQKKIMQEPAVLEFMSAATKHFDESLYAGKVALLIDRMRIGGHDHLSHSMHSLTCFCEVKKVLKKPLPIRSTARFKFQPGAARMLALDLVDEPDLIPDLREVIAHARLGKIRKFKSMTEKEPQLYKKAVDVHGNNLLHIAASYGRKRIVEEIIRNKDKLDIFARNKYDKTAIDLAVEFKNHEIAAYLHQELPDLDELSSVVEVSEFVFQFVDSDNDGWINQAEYNAAFDLLDKDQDGFINRKEFGTASLIAFVILDKDGDNRLSRKEYEAGFYIFDFDGDGLICRAEFDGKAVPSFTFENLDTDGDGKISREDYQRGFDLLDANRDGFISELEFSTICSAPFSLFDSDGDGKLSRTEYEAGFDFFDIDKDGFLNKSEFLLVQSSNIFMEKAKVQGIRIDFTLHGTYPGCLSMPGGSAYLSFGAHADFVTYPPVKICSNSSGQAAGTPVEVSAWFIVGNESGPWNFAYGNTFTEISLDVNLDSGVPQTPSTVPQTCSDRPTTSAKSQTLHAMPFLINLASEKANTQVASTDLSRRNDGSSGHYSRAEFVAEFAALNRRLSDIKAVAARNAEEAQAEEQHLKRSRLIVRDAMNRPVLVDGIVRGISLCSIVAPWRRDALGRIIVPDGIQRNTHIEINTEADWRERVLIGVDASDETELDEMDVYTGDFDIGDFVDSLLTSALGCYDSLPDDSDDAIAEVLGEVEPSELQGLLQEALKFGSAVLVPNRTPSNYTDLVNHSNSSNT